MDCRQKWVANFWTLENLRGLKFQRAVIPKDAISRKMRLMTFTDAARDLIVMVTYAGFERADGSIC